jgi:hypothetical protein
VRLPSGWSIFPISINGVGSIGSFYFKLSIDEICVARGQALYPFREVRKIERYFLHDSLIPKIILCIKTGAEQVKQDTGDSGK